TESREKTVVWIDLALWDAATGKLLHQTEVTWEHRGPIIGRPHLSDWNVSPDTTLLVASETFLGRKVPGTVPGLCVKDTRTGKTVFQSQDSTAGVVRSRFTPDSRTLLDVHRLRAIDLATGKVRELPRGKTPIRPWGSELSADGKVLVVDDG